MAAWKEGWKTKTVPWKKGQADAPASVFIDKKKRALDKMRNFMSIEPGSVVEEIPIEPPPRITAKRRKEAERLRDSFNYRKEASLF